MSGILLKELDLYLQNLLEPNPFNDCCLNGIQVRGKESVQRIATAVSVSIDAVEEALDLNADALIVHHGLFWHRDSPLVAGAKKEKLKQLLAHDMSLIAYHLPLDAHPEVGNNWRAARDLNWQQLKPFGQFQGKAIGVSGTFKPRPFSQFKKEVEEYYGHLAHTAAGGPDLLQSAALISGGAHRSIDEALIAGVDCFITGSFDEPTWYQALEGKIHFMALGHSATEKVGPKALAERLRSDLAHLALEVSFIDNANPF